LKRRVHPKLVSHLIQLKKPEESLEDVIKIDCPENYLLRWINHHLKNAGSNKEINNFSIDLKVKLFI